MPDLDAIRDFVNDWALLITGVLGAIATYDKAKRQIGKWWGNLNLFGRVHKLEVAVDELHSLTPNGEA